MTHEHDRDTIVVSDDAGGSSTMGMVLGIIGIVVLLIAVWYFALGPGSTGTTNTTNNNNTTINPPAASAPALPQGSSAP